MTTYLKVKFDRSKPSKMLFKRSSLEATITFGLENVLPKLERPQQLISLDNDGSLTVHGGKEEIRSIAKNEP